MEMGSMTSLAEVGVGLNLAFGLIKGVRERLSGLLRPRLERAKDSVVAALTECMKLDVDRSRIGVQVSDIEQAFQDRSNFVERVGVVLAFSVAVGLVYFLYEAALEPVRAVSDRWAAFMFVLVWLAIGTSFLGQVVVFLLAVWKMRLWRKTLVDGAQALNKVLITPTPVDNGADSG